MSPPTRLALLLLAAAPAVAQTGTASIVGAVADPQGAAVPGASIAVQNLDTGRTLRVTALASGEYKVPALDPGSYRVIAGAAGFKETVVEPVRVDVGAVVRVDVALAIGATHETITVSGARAALVQTDTSSIENTVENKQILELPLDGRNVLDLVYLSAGTVRNEALGGLGDYSADGNRPHSNNFIIDGVVNRDEFRGQNGVGVSVDAVREFKIKKSTASAEYGGGSTSMVLAIRSGTNSFHGSAFEFNRSKIGRARDYFDTSNSIPRFLRNQFGGSLGGPVRRNRTFFFVNYEGTRARSASTQLFSVPTPEMRNGDFRGATGASGQRLTLRQPSWIPFTLAPGQPLYTQPNVVNPVYLADSPSNPNRANARIANAVLALYRLPNLPGQFNNLSIGQVQMSGGNSVTWRADHQLAAMHNLSARMTLSMPGQYVTPNPRAPSLATIPQSRALNTGIGLISILKPTLTNEFNIGLQRFREQFGFSPESDFISAYGIREPYPPQTGDFSLDRMPNFVFNGDGRIDQMSYGVNTSGDNIPRLMETSTVPVSDTVTWEKGRQTVKAGFQLRFLRLSNFGNTNPRGVITYNGGTNLRWSGSAVADLLIGLPSSSTFPLLPPVVRYRTPEKSFFVQTDRQLGRSVTLNAGLRWEQRPPMTEDSDAITSFDVSLGKIVVASPGGTVPRAAYPFLLEQYKNLITTATAAGWNERKLSNPDNNNFAPRVGLAWRLDRNAATVVRTAYAIFYSYYPFQQATQISQLVPFALVAAVPSPLNDQLTNQNPYRTGTGGLTGAGFEKNFRDGYNQQWNFAIERVLFRESVATVTYVGNKGVHLPWATILDFPGFNRGNMRQIASRGNSNYNALQAEVRRRYGRGFFYQFNWTWAKSLDDHMIGQNAEFQIYASSLRLNRGDSPFVRRHVMRANSVWQMPFGKGKPYGANWGPLLDGALGGWSLGGIASFSTGGFLTPTVQGGLYSSRPDRVAGVPVVLNYDDRRRLASETGDPSWLDRSKRWYNVRAFRLVDSDSGRFGNAGRNIIVGPRFFNLDAVLSKSFRVSEQARVSARIEAFNLPNHTNFALGSGPSPSLVLAVNAPNAGSFTRTSGNPRQFQFGLRFDF